MLTLLYVGVRNAPEAVRNVMTGSTSEPFCTLCGILPSQFTFHSQSTC